MLLVTFSGLDGSGKSTHAARTVAYLKGRGYRVYTFATAHMSAAGLVTLVRHVLGRGRPAWGSTGECRTTADGGTPAESPPQNVRYSWGQRVRIARSWLIYPLDCLMIVFWLRFISLLGYTAVVCDRYIYDKIVNLPNPDCALQRLILKVSPRPNLAFLLDVSAATARQRRPEHEADYYATRHAGYGRLLTMECGLTPVPSTTVEETQQRLESALEALPPPASVAAAAS